MLTTGVVPNAPATVTAAFAFAVGGSLELERRLASMSRSRR